MNCLDYYPLGKWVGKITCPAGKSIACENIRFSSLFAAGDVSRGGTSATQWQKFHTDDANQCLHNKSGSHGVPNTNLYSFTCLLVDFGKSALLTRFRTDFASSVWNFCRWVADVPPRETSPAAKSAEKRIFWQARRPLASIVSCLTWPTGKLH